MTGPVVSAAAGTSKVIFDLREVMAEVDRITAGAASTFIKAAHRQMDPVVAEARTGKLWPVRTGASKAATETQDRIEPDYIKVVALSTLARTYRIRWSVRTAESLDNEARNWSAALWGKLAPYLARVNPTDASLRGPYAGRSGARRRLTSWALRSKPRGLDLSGGDTFGWKSKAEPSQEALRHLWRGTLHGRHGQGAPTTALAGKQVWGELVRKPAKAREQAVIDEARDALDKLAGG